MARARSPLAPASAARSAPAIKAYARAGKAQEQHAAAPAVHRAFLCPHRHLRPSHENAHVSRVRCGGREGALLSELVLLILSSHP